MKKVILIDGNNLLFRSYYATAYTGNMMKNSKGFPTNALYGLVNMLNKIISEEKPEYIIVALDKGKTFRHDSYDDYKAGRIETPDELKMQFPVAKEILSNMGIKYYECDNYEADDIIGKVAKMVDEDPDFIGTIVSSDKDLLQLISNDIDVKLLKTKDFIRMDRNVFYETYGIEPIRMIDLKGLQGDSSDNIPGVKGIGEKTALKLLQEYTSLENIYANIDNIKGAVKDKLIADKDNAFMSKSLATIYKDVPLDINFEDIKYTGPNTIGLNTIYNELEFYSFLKETKKKVEITNDVKIINDLSEINIKDDCAVYLETSGDNYHNCLVLGMGVYNETSSLFIPFEVLSKNPKFLIDNIKYTYDVKKMKVALKWHNIEIDNISFDLMIAGYILNYNIKDDIAYLANQLNYDLPFEDKKEVRDIKLIADIAVKKARFIYENKTRFIDELIKDETIDLFTNIELPLASVLAKMELEGINVDQKILTEMGEEIKIKLELISKDIYNHVGYEFNISSPKQLGEALFEKLELPYGKKMKTGHSTDVSVLMKLKGRHPVIDLILEYRMLSKLYGTYIEGIINVIMPDHKIHTIYTQTLTRTGRLSSIEPNLQNIPIRYDYGRLIRKAFVPTTNSLIMSSDYSQIELRILAHVSKVKELIDAFKNGLDIHTKTAMEVFDVPENMVTKDMRRQAKAVNFGIIYGISSFGLSENLDINVYDAKKFIDKYLETFPGIKQYMDDCIKDAYAKGYVKTLMNHKRYIDELKNKNYMIRSQGERMALNMPIQGSQADILKKAMVEIDLEMTKLNLKSRMLLQVHDELIFNVLKDEKEIMTKIVTEIMENTYLLSVPLKVEIDFGNNWYEAK